MRIGLLPEWSVRISDDLVKRGLNGRESFRIS